MEQNEKEKEKANEMTDISELLSALPPRHDAADRFNETIRACIDGNGATCMDLLQNIKPSDMHAFKDKHPKSAEKVDKLIADALTNEEDVYKILGLHIALLIQGVDLHKDSTGALSKNSAGAPAKFLSAVIRQAVLARLHKRNTERSFLYVISAVVVLLLLCVVGLLIALLTKP